MRTTILGKRYYVEISDGGVYVIDGQYDERYDPQAYPDSKVREQAIVRHWPHQRSTCPTCGSSIRTSEQGSVRQAMELCSRLNNREIEVWLNKVNEASCRVLRETPEEKQRNLTEAALAVGADNVNLIT